jgi:hypothetical protein
MEARSIMKPDAEDLDAQLQRLDGTIKRLQSEVPQKAESPKEELPPFSCPRCAVAMKPGRMKLHGNIGTFLMFGFGLEHGWFEESDGGKERKVFDSTEVRPAHFCEGCGTVILWGKA